jgi:broad specificity phosphatase PhoE
MTRVILIHAGPTPWDVANRLTGAQSLPLTPDALASIRSIVDAIPTPPTSLYLHKANEACLEAGKLVAKKFNLRIRDHEDLGEMKLGLWEGLTRDEVRRRFPTVIPQWQEEPLSVRPPEGESLGEVIDRVAPPLKKIIWRNRDGVVAIVVRPLVMQIIQGLLRDETPEIIAKHLNSVDMVETIDLTT